MKQNLKYGFRKSKVARSLCGAVLGAAAIVSFGAVSASADEVKAEPEKTVVKAGEESVAAQPQQEKEQPSSVEEFKGLDKTPVEVEKVEKATPVVENPNPTPVEPKQTEFKPEVKSTEPTIEKVSDGKGSSQIEFTAKSNTSVTTEVSEKEVYKPADVLGILDSSPSMAANFTKARKDFRALVNSGTDTERYTVAFYDTNTAVSYRAKDWYNPGSMKREPAGLITKPMTKEQTLKFLDRLDKFEVTKAGVDFENLQSYLKIQNFPLEKGDGRGFEEVFASHLRQGSTTSVIQFTDGWMGGEKIDETLASWAKTKKTFMSVVYDDDALANDGQRSSVSEMKKAGHPNIYEAGEKTDAQRANDIVSQFKNTALEKVTKTVSKTTKQKGTISIAAQGLSLTSAKLTDPTGKTTELPIKDGKASYAAELSDGKYTVSYTYAGEGTVTGTVNLDGKEVAKKDDTLSSKGGFVKADFRTNDGKTISGKNDLIVSEAGKGIGADWKAPEADKSIVVNGQTYVLVGVPKTQAGKVTKDNVTLHYVYQAKPSDKKVYTVNLKVLDAITGKQIDKEFVVAKGFEGSGYNVLSPKVDGYEVTLKEGSAAGKLSNKDVTLIYLAHEKGGQVKAVFTDESGKELKDSEVISETGTLVGSGWKYDSEFQKEIKVGDKTYILTAVPERLQGEVTSDNQTLKFVYKLKEEPKPEQPAKPAKPKENKTAPKALPKTSAVPGTNVAKSDVSAQLALIAAASAVSYAAGYGYTKKRKND